ncbi:MAG: PKD domain-containing protein, partial [Actinomycetota bacterium]|nr:PKD domain-containing protein [Actinomycetota bacterium]
SLTVAFRACDTPGACSTDTASVRVTNVAPRVNAGPDRRARRRARVRVTARITDPGPGDRFRIAWTCGNGARGTGRTATCRYRRAGRFTIRFTVTDDDGGRGADSVRVRVRR